jgi:putative aldouronate transport system permease protein
VKITASPSRKAFNVLNILVLCVLALACVIPFIHVIAVSLSGKLEAAAGLVKLWPQSFTVETYEYLLRKAVFWRSFMVSVQRLVLGTAVNLILILLCAYPLSKSREKFRMRGLYAWYFFITMLIGGGLIPTYIVVSSLGLRDTLWALILPNAVPVFNLILMLNFFRQVPPELEEASFIDGAGHFRQLVQIYIPVSVPTIATLALFCMVSHWNAWFDGIIYTNTPGKLPLQSYLRSIVIDMDMSQMDSENWADLQNISDRALRSAQIVIATIPILAVYPFLQRYFVTGIVLGSVKG